MFFRGASAIFILFLSFFLFELITLSHYGTDWDTINHLPRGQAYLQYIFNGQPNYKNLPEYVEYYQKENSLLFSPNKPKESISKRSLYQIDGSDASYFLTKDRGHPPLSDILSSAFNVILFQQARLINDIDSYHVYIILMASFLVSLLFWWTRKYYGRFAALITVLSLILYPLFLGESHFNVKDIPQATFYSLMIIFLYEGITNKRSSLLFLSAVFFGCAWGTKFNILFSPFIIIPWVIIYMKQNIKLFKQIVWLIPSIVIFPLIAIAIFWGSWPYLWKDSIPHFLKVVNYYKTIGINPNFDPSFIHAGLNTYAIQWILYTTPLVTLFFTLFGIVYTFTKRLKEKEKTSLLVLLWFIVPIARVTMPNAGIYGGVRQIMEYIPAIAILSGIGATYMVAWLHGYMVKLFKVSNHVAIQLLQLLVIFSFIPITIKLVSIHPNENVYFNPLIGGLKGAKERNFPYWGNSFGNTYRQGTHWINTHAENKSTLVLAQELMPNLPRQFVRGDIMYGNNLRSGYTRKGEYIIGLDYGSEANRSYYSSRYYNKYLKPIHQIKIDDTSILNIWKNEEKYTKKEFLNEKKISNPSYAGTERGILIDLKKPLVISKIQWSFSDNNCQSAKLIYFNVSMDIKSWYKTPHSLPEDLPIPILERQPAGNSVAYPFAAESARYIYVVIDPINACVKNVKTLDVYYLPDASPL